ncbi:alpha/beta hydrolase [Marinomonas sp. THO17]|uniref:alpha/beta fold hydrolase n=1 Tax=Marinomonas sp. THO17 TaxID=3149048 RepID=UPI00336BE423
MKPLFSRVPLVTLCSLALAACTTPEDIRKNQTTTKLVLNTSGLTKDAYIEVNHHLGQYKLHYKTNDLSIRPRQTVVFVHGTPGSWSSFSKYYLEQPFEQEFRLISLDRPGWGESSYPGDAFPLSLETQSQLLGPMLKSIWESNDRQKYTLVGHSLGGSLVPLLAADYPQYIKGVVILAGDLDAKLAAARWYNHVLDWVPEAIIPDIWKHSNDEVLALSPGLANAREKFSAITQPIQVIQGTDDELVRPNNASLATSLFKNSKVQVKWLAGAGHIINLTHVDDVKQAIREISHNP